MTCDQIDKLYRISKHAKWHLNECKRLSEDSSAQLKALWHQQNAERLQFVISNLIRYSTSTAAIHGRNLGESGALA